MKKMIYSGFTMISLACTVFGDNILKNGDFEKNLKYWVPIRQQEPAGTVSSDVSYGGSKALCLFREGDKGNYLYHGITFEQGKSYKLSCAIKCEGADKNDLTIKILGLKNDGTGKYKPFQWINRHGVFKLIRDGGDHDWKEFSITITPKMIPSEVERCTLIIERKNNGKGKIYIDDIAIEPIEAKEEK